MVCVILCPLVAKGDDTFTPTMPTRPLPQDVNNNGIADTLDQEIAEKIASGEGDEYVNVVVMLEHEPSSLDLGAFVSAGGKVTAGPWKYAIYGFGGSIQYDKIDSFAQNCSDLIFIEKDAVFGIGPPPYQTIPEYSAQTLLFAMIGIVFLIFSAKKIAQNKKRSYLPRVPESPHN
ncbi:MAG: hypothetical protein ABSB28_09985 [Candidatus Bathyarchaeia archaeon]